MDPDTPASSGDQSHGLSQALNKLVAKEEQRAARARPQVAAINAKLEHVQRIAKLAQQLPDAPGLDQLLETLTQLIRDVRDPRAPIRFLASMRQAVREQATRTLLDTLAKPNGVAIARQQLKPIQQPSAARKIEADIRDRIPNAIEARLKEQQPVIARLLASRDALVSGTAGPTQPKHVPQKKTARDLPTPSIERMRQAARALNSRRPHERLDLREVKQLYGLSQMSDYDFMHSTMYVERPGRGRSPWALPRHREPRARDHDTQRYSASAWWRVEEIQRAVREWIVRLERTPPAG